MIQVFHDLTQVIAAYRGGAIAIGNFDGVHKGHTAVIQAAAAAARGRGVNLGVLTFEPHPRSVLAHNDSPFRLTDWRGKARGLEKLGVDFMAICEFDMDLAALTAEDFVQNVLAEGLGVCHVAVGEDFQFGKDRAGNTGFLLEAGKRHGFDVTSVPAMAGSDGIVFSSSAVRAALGKGDVIRANELLGRPWEIEGVVTHGDKRGRTIGFPTMNIYLGDLTRPALGVYVVEAKFEDGERWIGGVANLGLRPTVGGEDERLEVHLFDFDKDVYDKHARIRLLNFVRPEKKFESFEALKEQIVQDAILARAYLETR